MRFTTWSTVKSTFIIATIALLSSIPAANADVEIVYTSPIAGVTYYIGQSIDIAWSISANDTNLDDVSGNIFLMVEYGTGAPYLLTSNVALLGNSTAYMVPIPPVYPDSHYYVEYDTSVGNFESGRFAIHIPGLSPA